VAFLAPPNAFDHGRLQLAWLSSWETWFGHFGRTMSTEQYVLTQEALSRLQQVGRLPWGPCPRPTPHRMQ
jgi:hypothetical protein